MRRGTGDRHTWASVTAKDIGESVWTVSLRGIPPKSAAWGVSEGEEGTQHSLLPLPGCPSCAGDSCGSAKGTKTSRFFLHCSKAAVLSRGILGLCRVPLQFSFCDLKFVFSGFLSCFVHAASSVQAFCPNQVHAGRMTGSSQFDSWPGTLQKSTFLLP